MYPLRFLRIIYSLLEAEINAWYSQRIDNNNFHKGTYDFDTIRMMEFQSEQMQKEIERREKDGEN